MSSQREVLIRILALFQRKTLPNHKMQLFNSFRFFDYIWKQALDVALFFRCELTDPFTDLVKCLQRLDMK